MLNDGWRRRVPVNPHGGPSHQALQATEGRIYTHSPIPIQKMGSFILTCHLLLPHFTFTFA